MKAIGLGVLLSFSLAAMAEVGDISCVAKQFTVGASELRDYVEKPLVLESKVGTSVRYGVDIGGRYYSLVGDTAGTGDFLLTQAWGPEYTFGINSRASFNSTGHLQMSQVEQDKVFRLECARVTSTSFPKE
jgi:hypothetical protein